MGNIYILLIFLLYLIMKNQYHKYFSEEYRNLSESIFVENNARFSDYNILALKKPANPEKPTLLTDFRFSEAHKLGFEISKLQPFNLKYNEGMYSNLDKILKQGSENQLCFCTENDIHHYMKNNDTNDLLRIVCSFYRMEMIFIINSEFRINNINEIIEMIKRKKVERKKFKLGILDDKHSSHFDAIKVLNCMSIDENTEGFQLKEYPTMRELIHRFDNNEVDFIYLTTTSKNKYIIELLKKNFVNIVGLSGINESLIRSNFNSVFLNDINSNKYNRIVIESDGLNMVSTDIYGKKLKVLTYSTRLFLVCRKELPKDMIYNTIKSIYGNRIKLQEKMTKFFLTNKNNTLDKLMDAFEMFHINENLKYHDGAKKFYENIGFISYDKKTSLVNKNVKSKLMNNLDGPFQKLFTRK